METEMNYFIENIFNKSKNQIGNIYLCNTRNKIVNKRTNEIIEDVILYKYGKTKDIIRRMQMYSKAYTLIKTWDVNHLSLREYFIHVDACIKEDRREHSKDERDEHVNFNCEDIVDFYCNSKIILEKNRIFIKRKNEEISYDYKVILNILHM
jgi:hypothetical protein